MRFAVIASPGATGFKLFSIGGFDGRFAPTPAVVALNLDASGVPVAGEAWTEMAPLPGPSLAQMAAASIGNDVFGLGGLGPPGAGNAAAMLAV